MPKTKPKHPKLSQYDKGFQDGHRVGYNEGYDKGRVDGFETYEVCAVYSMKDKYKLEDVDVLMLIDAFHEYVSMVCNGFHTLQEMEAALLKTFKYKFKWVK